MTTVQKAATEARNFLKQFRGLYALAEELDALGKLDTHNSELAAENTRLQTHRDEVMKEIETAKEELAKTRASTKKVLSDAGTKEHLSIQAAKQNVADAADEAAQIISEAQREAKRIVDEAAAKVEDAKKELKDLTAKAAATAKEYEATKRSIDALREKLAATE